MSETPHYDYGTSVCSVAERGAMYLDGVPEDIESELDRANFDREGDRWVKRRQRIGLDDDGDGLVVLSVTVEGDGDRLRVEPEDVVGVVSLVPGTNVEVEPKVGWDATVEMLLTVYGLDRTDSYFGVPLSDVLSGGIDTSQIVALLAINYVRGVRTVRREGLVREIDIRRRTGFEGRGSIDMAATLRNRARGEERPVWIDTDVQYDSPINAALHRAGRVLLGLLHQNPANVDHPEFETLRSLVAREVRQLEADGVESDPRSIPDYRRLSVEDLPRQRRYYRRALRVSRSILAASLLGGGTEDLLVDYAFGMDRLFQDYTQQVLESELASLREVDHLDELAAVECLEEHSIRPFEDGSFRHEPDHLLRDGEETIAILDSKYYAEGKNPLSDGSARSRLFAYGYLTDSDRFALLTPGYHDETYRFRDVEGEVEIVSPGPGGDFSTEAYRDRVRAYLQHVLCEAYPKLETFLAAEEYHVALQGVENDLRRATDTSGPFQIRDKTFQNQVLVGLKFLSDGPDASELQDDGATVKSDIRDVLDKIEDDGRRVYPGHRTTCIPIYRPKDELDDHDGFGPDDPDGVVELHFLDTDDGDTPAEELDKRNWERHVERVPVR